LELCGNDQEILLSVMDVYVKSADKVKDRIINAMIAKDLPNYAIEVHGVKSSSRSVGNDKLGELAYALELKSKEGDMDFVNSKHEEFFDEYCRFVDRLKEKLDEISGDENTDYLEISIPELKEMLARCSEAMENFETRTASEIMNDMLRGDFDKEIIGRLKEAKGAAELFDFDIASNILKELYLSLRNKDDTRIYS